MRRQQGGGSGAATPGAEGSELAGATEAELQEKAKRKGRFRCVCNNSCPVPACPFPMAARSASDGASRALC